MKRTLALLFVFVFFHISFDVCSQNEKIPPSDVPKVTTIGIKISKTAVNRVSETTTVYTYKVENAAIKDIPSDDVARGGIQNTEINAVIHDFLTKEGVIRATFDAATKTITVVINNDALK